MTQEFIPSPAKLWDLQVKPCGHFFVKHTHGHGKSTRINLNLREKLGTPLIQWIIMAQWHSISYHHVPQLQQAIKRSKNNGYKTTPQACQHEQAIFTDSATPGGKTLEHGDLIWVNSCKRVI